MIYICLLTNSLFVYILVQVGNLSTKSEVSSIFYERWNLFLFLAYSTAIYFM